jgi:hypothetical protein
VVLRGVEKASRKEEKRATRVLSSSVNQILEAPLQQGDKSAKSSTPPLNGERTSGVIVTGVEHEEARRTLVTTQDQLAGVVADLKDIDLIALDLETTGLDPRKDSIRLLSLATKAATYIVDCRSVDPAELFFLLGERTLVAHNALFDLGFLSSLGFVPGKAADTMILSQLLYADSKVEPLKRGQTSHSLASVVERELGLELDKTHQNSDWGGALTPEMIAGSRKSNLFAPQRVALTEDIKNIRTSEAAPVKSRRSPARATNPGRATTPVSAASCLSSCAVALTSY